MSIEINGERVRESDTVNFLGVSLDGGVNWHSHVDNLVDRLSSVCHILRVVSKYVDLD